MREKEREWYDKLVPAKIRENEGEERGFKKAQPLPMGVGR